MPELGRPPVKNREDKYHIIGRAYSTMNPRCWVNYIQFSIIFSEFFQERPPACDRMHLARDHVCISPLQMVSVTFQPYVGWRDVGSREEDGWLVCGLQSFLREFVGYSVDQVLLALLVTFSTPYL